MITCISPLPEYFVHFPLALCWHVFSFACSIMRQHSTSKTYPERSQRRLEHTRSTRRILLADGRSSLWPERRKKCSFDGENVAWTLKMFASSSARASTTHRNRACADISILSGKGCSDVVLRFGAACHRERCFFLACRKTPRQTHGHWAATDQNVLVTLHTRPPPPILPKRYRPASSVSGLDESKPELPVTWRENVRKGKTSDTKSKIPTLCEKWARQRSSMGLDHAGAWCVDTCDQNCKVHRKRMTKGLYTASSEIWPHTTWLLRQKVSGLSRLCAKSVAQQCFCRHQETFKCVDICNLVGGWHGKLGLCPVVIGAWWHSAFSFLVRLCSFSFAWPCLQWTLGQRLTQVHDV